MNTFIFVFEPPKIIASHLPMRGKKSSHPKSKTSPYIGQCKKAGFYLTELIYKYSTLSNQDEANTCISYLYCCQLTHSVTTDFEVYKWTKKNIKVDLILFHNLCIRECTQACMPMHIHRLHTLKHQ